MILIIFQTFQELLVDLARDGEFVILDNKVIAIVLTSTVCPGSSDPT